jgi:hypothetical protein
MSIYRVNNKWYIDKYINGIRIRKTAGNTQTEADSLLRIFKAEYNLQQLKNKAGLNCNEVNHLNLLQLKTPTLSNIKIPEKTVEQYLIKNLHLLEDDLIYKSHQHFIATGRLDILAETSNGENIFIEIKSCKLGKFDSYYVDSLVGQVSRYFNDPTTKERLIIIIPLCFQKYINSFTSGLNHWIKNNKITIYGFDYMIYQKKFTFEKIL